MESEKNNTRTLSQALSGAEAFNLENRAFKGRYQTELFSKDGERRLSIPNKYQELLQFGGVITVGTDEHLLLFSGQHWRSMVKTLADQLGINPDSNALVRQVYGRHVEFDQLNDEGNGVRSITLNDDLINYAGLRDTVVLVGLIYYAEVHRAQHFYDQLLSPTDLRQLSAALR